LNQHTKLHTGERTLNDHGITSHAIWKRGVAHSTFRLKYLESALGLSFKIWAILRKKRLSERK